MPSRCVLALLLVLALGTSSRAVAGSWALRVEAGTTDYSHRTFSGSQFGYSELSLEDDKGFGVAGEYRPTPHIGLELSLSSIDLDARWREVEVRPISFNPTVFREVTIASDSGSFSLRPVAVAFLLHPLRQSRLDFYVGPQISWVDFHVGLHGPPHRDAELGIGGKLGVELGLAHSPWSAGIGYRFLETQHEGMEHDQYTGIGVHIVSAVLSYRVGRAGT